MPTLLISLASMLIPIFLWTLVQRTNAAPAEGGHGHEASHNDVTAGHAVATLQSNHASDSHVVVHWGYKDATDESPPTRWQETYSDCAGHRQSPIAINEESLTLDPSLESLDFSSYHMQPLANNWTVVNNGHVVQFSGKFASVPELRHGSLGTSYIFTQFHFHWGSMDSRGSEHVVDNKRYPLELHLVHRKVTDTDEQAGKDSTGLTVVGILFEVADDHEAPNIHMEALTAAVQKAVDPNIPVTLKIPELNLEDLIPDSEAYYRYLGSLTTPPCAEAVVWNVMKKPLKITEDQLKVFRSLHQHSGTRLQDDFLSDNFRPIQESNGRVVRFHPDVSASESSTHKSNSSPEKIQQATPRPKNGAIAKTSCLFLFATSTILLVALT